MNHLHRTYGPNLSDIFSGDVLHSILSSPTDTLQALNEAVNDDAKIRNNTQSTKNKLRKFRHKDYEINYNGTYTQTRNELRRLFSIEKIGATVYVVYDIPKGRMALRLADHNANGNNFEQDNANSNISVYVAFREFDVPESQIPFREYKIPVETFNTRRKEVVDAIINAVDSALKGDEFNIPEDLADRQDYPIKDSYQFRSPHLLNESKRKLSNIDLIRKMMIFDFDE